MVHLRRGLEEHAEDDEGVVEAVDDEGDEDVLGLPDGVVHDESGDEGAGDHEPHQVL